MEVEAEADQLWRRIVIEVPEERDRRALRLILDGESSTEALAQALGVESDLPAERRHLVKQYRDRLTKVLERLGRKLKP
jgi:RNA polymerase sigma-70 factor (ECF subfamily)